MAARVHPHSASSKQWVPHPESLEERQTRPPRPVSTVGPLNGLNLNDGSPYVDEEKGRKFTPTNSVASLSLSSRNSTSSFPPFPATVATLPTPSPPTADDDDDVLDAWLQSHGDPEATSPEGSSNGEDLDADKHAAVTWVSPLQADDEEAAFWTAALASTVESPTANVNVDFTRVPLLPFNHSTKALTCFYLDSERGLTYIPAAIDDLDKIVSFPQTESTEQLGVRAREFARTKSESTLPAPISAKPGLLRPRAPMARTNTMPAIPALLGSPVHLALYIPKNEITADSISWRLFYIRHLAVLSLRLNPLGRLPEAVGRLSHLEELNVSNCGLQYLPAEILRLPKLQLLSLTGNPFHPAPTDTPRSPTARILSPPTVHWRILPLVEIAKRALLFRSISHPSEMRQEFSAKSLVWDSPLADPVRSTLFPSLATPPHGPQPFDPSANVCRSAHHPYDERRFVSPAVERLEWISEASFRNRGEWAESADQRLAGGRLIPVRHRGCGPLCLDWLEQAEP